MLFFAGKNAGSRRNVIGVDANEYFVVGVLDRGDIVIEHLFNYGRFPPGRYKQGDWFFGQRTFRGSRDLRSCRPSRGELVKQRKAPEVDCAEVQKEIIQTARQHPDGQGGEQTGCEPVEPKHALIAAFSGYCRGNTNRFRIRLSRLFPITPSGQVLRAELFWEGC